MTGAMYALPIVALTFFLSVSSVSADTELEQYIQRCNKDPANGKLGPIGQPPPTKCVTGQRIQEGKNAKFFDSLVIIDNLGRVKACNTPIPLDEKCEPTRPAELEYCDNVAKEASGNKGSGCGKVPKENNPESLDAVMKMGVHLLDPANQRDYLARGLLAAMKENLNTNLPSDISSAIRDPVGMYLPMDDREKALTPYLNDIDRRVEGPIDSLGALVGYEPLDAARLDAAREFADRAIARDLDPWASVPRYIDNIGANPSFMYGDRPLNLSTDDQGVAVNYYPRPADQFPGQVLGGRDSPGVPMPGVPYPGTAPQNPYVPTTFGNTYQPPATGYSSVQQTYASTLAAVQQRLTAIWRWLTSW